MNRFRFDPRERRDATVRRVRHYLLQSSFPRLQMLLMVALTGAAGLLASWLLLDAGVTSMALRYPLAVALAYAVFLALLWLWMRTHADEWLDHLSRELPSPGHRSTAEPACAVTETGTGADTASGLDALGAVDGEFAIPLMLLLALVVVCGALLFAVGSVVWSAPALLAELLFDGVLAAGLYRRLRRGDAQHWLQSAWRHTAWPFVLCVVFAAIAGFALQQHAPYATTLSQALDAPSN